MRRVEAVMKRGPAGRNWFPVSVHTNTGRGTITLRIRHEPRGSTSRDKVRAVADAVVQQLDLPDHLVRRREFSARVDLEYRPSLELMARCLKLQQTGQQHDDPNQLSFRDLSPA